MKPLGVTIVERRFTRDLIDVTCLGDSTRKYIAGRTRAEETVVERFAMTVKCEYCSTVNEHLGNCDSCGGPLPEPQF